MDRRRLGSQHKARTGDDIAAERDESDLVELGAGPRGEIVGGSEDLGRPRHVEDLGIGEGEDLDAVGKRGRLWHEPSDDWHNGHVIPR